MRKRLIAFLFVVLFDIVFLVSCLPGVCYEHYGKMMCVAGQTGLGISLVAFFMLPGKKRLPRVRNRDERN